MTEHHPVTKEELEQIGFGWQMGQYEIYKKVSARPDPLEVLEKWLLTDKVYFEYGTPDDIVDEIKTVVKELRNSPESVIKRGIEEGWL